ncbi:sodium:proton antiporter [Periweissella cryptocerci]|uniref:Sodium:proton antiporter n=1 Tax=Periweissella cryptocerci TaxID=2506420 RepID=A0A4P6YRD3_9LACO|nr:sodium:proton antiporter [Periweissella cryptocerci]QBO35198.1 sodium:proton antiporter [Periweissella cryptocerci]
MAIFYLLALLVVGVIAANMLHEVFPKVPDAFVLIVIGVLLSLTSIMRNFELEPEYFMLLIIAPLMFNDGQKTSLKGVRKNVRAIFLLAVVLAVVTVAIVGMLANRLEVQWTLPLALALAAIVTPTDAVAVKSLTAQSKIDTGVDNALEYEALFNDASGLVMLDLALSVMAKGSISVWDGLGHFVFVAVGGIAVGAITGFLLVTVRTFFNRRAVTPELTIIPIALLTPFVVYLLAEHVGTSGIIAVVTAGMIHNFESENLKLTATRVQLVSTTIWDTISALLNSFVFILLGVSLPRVFEEFGELGARASWQLIGLGFVIYVVMLLIRFLAGRIGDIPESTLYFGPHNSKKRNTNSAVFALSGVHGTITLAMAFSLPLMIAGHAFPYREELLILATVIILLSMIVPALVLPRILPAKDLSFNETELENARVQMIDYASLHLTEQITVDDVRFAVIGQLQSQKGFGDETQHRQQYYQIWSMVGQLEDDFLNSNEVKEMYEPRVLSVYRKILNTYSGQRFNILRKFNDIKHVVAHELWHAKQGQFTHKQRLNSRQEWQKAHADAAQQHDDFREQLWQLETQLHERLENYLTDLAKERLTNSHEEITDIQFVQRTLEERQRYFRQDYVENEKIPVDLFIQAFQLEYNYVQTQFVAGNLNEALANKLYDEINQAQTLQLQQLAVEN